MAMGAWLAIALASTWPLESAQAEPLSPRLVADGPAAEAEPDHAYLVAPGPATAPTFVEPPPPGGLLKPGVKTARAPSTGWRIVRSGGKFVLRRVGLGIPAAVFGTLAMLAPDRALLYDDGDAKGKLRFYDEGVIRFDGHRNVQHPCQRNVCPAPTRRYFSFDAKRSERFPQLYLDRHGRVRALRNEVEGGAEFSIFPAGVALTDIEGLDVALFKGNKPPQGPDTRIPTGTEGEEAAAHPQKPRYGIIYSPDIEDVEFDDDGRPVYVLKSDRSKRSLASHSGTGAAAASGGMGFVPPGSTVIDGKVTWPSLAFRAPDGNEYRIAVVDGLAKFADDVPPDVVELLLIKAEVNPNAFRQLGIIALQPPNDPGTSAEPENTYFVDTLDATQSERDMIREAQSRLKRFSGTAKQRILYFDGLLAQITAKNPEWTFNSDPIEGGGTARYGGLGNGIFFHPDGRVFGNSLFDAAAVKEIGPPMVVDWTALRAIDFPVLPDGPPEEMLKTTLAYLNSLPPDHRVRNADWTYLRQKIEAAHPNWSMPTVDYDVLLDGDAARVSTAEHRTPKVAGAEAGSIAVFESTNGEVLLLGPEGELLVGRGPVGPDGIALKRLQPEAEILSAPPTWKMELHELLLSGTGATLDENSRDFIREFVLDNPNPPKISIAFFSKTGQRGPEVNTPPEFLAQTIQDLASDPAIAHIAVYPTGFAPPETTLVAPGDLGGAGDGLPTPGVLPKLEKLGYRKVRINNGAGAAVDDVRHNLERLREVDVRDRNALDAAVINFNMLVSKTERRGRGWEHEDVRRLAGHFARIRTLVRYNTAYRNEADRLVGLLGTAALGTPPADINRAAADLGAGFDLPIQDIRDKYAEIVAAHPRAAAEMGLPSPEEWNEHLVFEGNVHPRVRLALQRLTPGLRPVHPLELSDIVVDNLDRRLVARLLEGMTDISSDAGRYVYRGVESRDELTTLMAQQDLHAPGRSVDTHLHVDGNIAESLLLSVTTDPRAAASYSMWREDGVLVQNGTMVTYDVDKLRTLGVPYLGPGDLALRILVDGKRSARERTMLLSSIMMALEDTEGLVLGRLPAEAIVETTDVVKSPGTRPSRFSDITRFYRWED